MAAVPEPERRPGVSRRSLLLGGAAGLGGVALGVAGAAGVAVAVSDAPAPDSAGQAVVPFFGTHQSGIATPAQAYAVLLAFDLRPSTDRRALGKLMRLWSDDAARLTQGLPALADTEPEMAAPPASLTVTFGFGRGVFDVAGGAGARPPGVEGLPAYAVDRLEDRWSGGDLLVQVCADDPTTLAHAVRMVVKDGRAFATVRWVQRGFLRGPGTSPPGSTPRNLLGQIDGSANPRPGTKVFDSTVWVSDGPEWLRGGTTVVVRRIAMDLDRWDSLDRSGKEQALGRTLDTGAPLTGGGEFSRPDLEAVGSSGLRVIPAFAHVRRSAVETTGVRIFRRGYNYDDGVSAEGRSDSGLLFVSCQADVMRQYAPIQQSLADLDLLNTWTTPVGSAVFAVPPGCEPGGWIGETLLG